MNKNLNSRSIPIAKEVDPIKKLKDIEKIKQYLKGKDNRRDYMLFVVGINVGLRAGDLLELRIKKVLNGNMINDSVLIQEQKTGKMREFTLNKSAKDAIQYYLNDKSILILRTTFFRARKEVTSPCSQCIG